MDYKNDILYRKETLKKLLHIIQQNEEAIINALYEDFKKPAFESVLTETSFVINELKYTIKNIKSWTAVERVAPSLLNFPSSDYIYKEPYGKVLIISPWNYPFHLAMVPLIAAVAAGNQVVLKPSELTPKTSKILAQIVKETFHVNHVEVVEGDAKTAETLLQERWDYIFFTGSTRVGKIIAKVAAKNLTPCTLELGGKNPCIIDDTANLKLTAKRIVWGKFLNAGQTCVAPDYLLVHHKMKKHLVGYLKDEIKKAYGTKPIESPDYARIINTKNWLRLIEMIDEEKIIFGGENDPNSNFIAPTLIDENSTETPLMKEEIFGPLLPILTYKSESDINAIIANYEKPLAFYVFSENDDFISKMIQKYSFGGGCVNDTLIHLANNRLPFGGNGNSGIGAYHGKFSFNTFSHQKSIVRKGNWLDIPLRYAPYKDKLSMLRKFLDKI